MGSVLFLLSVLTLLFWIFFSIDLIAGSFSTPFLKNIFPGGETPQPKVSVIIPARNEERNLDMALHSVLRQDYDDLEFIAINDRSTDTTGAILARMAAADRRLRVIELRKLPAGWLGKNYALYCGARNSTGELLLFTDADIVMHPSTVRAAVTYLMERHLDHLTLSPGIITPSIPLGMLKATFFILFSMLTRHWKARDANSAKSVGIGAFNLVRARAYRAAGTHRAIAMRPDDDLKLGRLIKMNGYRQELLFGQGMISVEWYSSVKDLINGLMKNAFASVNYSMVAVIAGTVVLFLVNLWPLLAVFLIHGPARILNGVAALLPMALASGGARFHGYKWWYGTGYPLCVLLFIGIIWKSALTALANNGINWRETHYPLAELKANKV